ncbi:hypothetical protein [Streptomyces sp. NL15-2K]|uniref:hypothetical protein n=1 Tax=Streptomyces sp. NL15-2K TaxID=376149 RepID=UPI000FFA98FA|nr:MULTISPECIES: hypothetical protein [Actinomycetes]WKX14249.1 hypothetical protein Q4V64_44740 [Kutzneria buriramensis]GCB43923.1 hypothetical protein SNL152K_1208 [Streptomyces sp. NL15-2K]
MARARPASLPAELPDAGTARRRARTGVCLLGALLVLPFAVGVLPGAREAGALLGLVTGTLAFVLYGMLVEESTPARHSMRRITARTLTGVRSVNLTRLTHVRLLTSFSYGSVYRTLLVRDADGVWLGITTAAGKRALRRALERLPGDGSVPPPRVSRAARAHLDGDRPGRIAVHTVLAFLVLVLGLCGYGTVLVELGGIG